MRPRDTQRARLYRWERLAFFRYDAAYTWAPLTDAEAQALAQQVFNSTGLWQACPVHIRRQARGNATKHRIHVPEWARVFPAYTIHEATHAQLDAEGDTTAWHSPVFVRRYLENLADVIGYNLDELLTSARAAGLRVAESS